MVFMTEYITFNTDDVVLKDGNLEVVRNSIDDSLSGEDAIVSVCVRIWRDSRLEKLKHCIDSVLKYERDVKFKLVLMNNGGSQAITDYFESIDYEDKVIIKITQNISAPHGGGIFKRFVKTKYMVELLNDNIVTPHWLSNMLHCLESDPKIGVACPMCTNCTSIQEPPFKDKSIAEMLSIAEQFNISDPSKWEELMCCIPQGAVYRRAVFDAVGIYDKGYIHEGADNDLSLRIRRGGYKQILCKDTFIIHDHNYDIELVTPLKAQHGRNGFYEKFHNIDSWYDIYNSVNPWLKSGKFKMQKAFRILGIECRTGNPMLEVKNKVHAIGNEDIICDAFTTEAKYYEDLLSVCDNVCCDSNENRVNTVFKGQYDFIVIGKELNNFDRPFDILDFALTHACGGQVLIKIKNMLDIGVLISCLGGKHPIRLSGMRYIELNEVVDFINGYKVKNIDIMREEVRSLKGITSRILAENGVEQLLAENSDSVKRKLETFMYWILISN